MSSEISELHGALSALYSNDAIVAEDLSQEGKERFRFTRQLSGASRYLEVGRSDETRYGVVVYAALFGEYETTDRQGDYDARTWGDLGFMRTFASRFMVDLCDSADLPRFEAPDPL